MPPSWTKGQHSMVPPPPNCMSWQFGTTPLYTLPSPQTPPLQTPSLQPTQFSSASPIPPAVGINASMTSVPMNSAPANSIPANSVPANSITANSVPANSVPANSDNSLANSVPTNSVSATPIIPTTDTLIAKVSLKGNTALPPIDRTSLLTLNRKASKVPTYVVY